MDDQRLELLMLGLAAGDSLGSSVEFQPRARMPQVYESLKPSGWPFRQTGGGPFDWQPGDPTDDTAMALALLRGSRKSGGFDGGAVAQEFIAWYDSVPRDIGTATRQSLAALRDGTPWFEGGLPGYQRNPNGAANGSLMRNGIVAGMAGSIDEAFAISLKQSIITHYAPLPVLCCCVQTFLIWEFLAGRDPFAGNWVQACVLQLEALLNDGADDVVTRWRDTVGSHVAEAITALVSTDFHPITASPYTLNFDNRDGYCLLTLQIAVWAAQWSQRGIPYPTPKGFPPEVFSRATGPMFLSAVVMAGHDADTYGAVAGPLIAAIHGYVSRELTEGLKVWGAMKTGG
jgi:ADP-ribosylglycohydrolase